MLTKAEGERLMTLHNRAVKACQRWEAATPGTQNKDKLDFAHARAETAFAVALIKLSSTKRRSR